MTFSHSPFFFQHRAPYTSKDKKDKPMEEIYANGSFSNISVVNGRGSSSSKKWLIVGLISLGILSVGLLIGLIRLGFHTHALSSSAAGLSDTKDQLSAMTKERDQLNATLLQRSNEVTRLQSLLKKYVTCPDVWRMFSFSCYLLITESGPWKKAREDCRKRGGYLVVINDDDEQKFVFTLSDKSPWIGLSEETEGSWKWVDGTALSSELKKFWGHGQPDNVNGSEDCAQILEVNKTWNDNNCGDSFPWICEKAPV